VCQILRGFSTVCTGIRIVRDVSAIAGALAWRSWPYTGSTVVGAGALAGGAAGVAAAIPVSAGQQS